MSTSLRKLSLYGATAFGLVMLAACGDENTTEVTEMTGIAMLEAGEEFPECDGESAGKMVYATDSSAVYYCAEGKWVTLNGKDGAAGKDGKDGVDGANGEDGAPGAAGTNGDPGADGSSCSAKSVENGIEISCAGSVIDTIMNGVDGSNGTSCTAEKIAAGLEIKCAGSVIDTITDGIDGAAGDDCSLTDNEDGTVSVTCGENTTTLYKAVCGVTAYEPSKNFCYEGELYNCGGKPYNPAKQYCLTLKDENGDASTRIEALLIDTRDMQVYKTVTVGTQVWMAQNLNYEIAGVSFCYEDNADSCAKYGHLYQWSSAKTVCPEGWHLPDNDEWNVLFTAVGGIDKASAPLKSTSGWLNDENGNDTYGFAALPAGYRYYDGDYISAAVDAEFWSATEYDDAKAYDIDINYANEFVSLATDEKDDGFSVRCIMDAVTP